MTDLKEIEGTATSGDVASEAAQATSARPASGHQSWRSRCREMQGVNRRKKNRKEGNQTDRQKERVNYSEEIAHNEEFEQYYKDQRICAEEEWDSFMTCCRSSLPMSFRFNTCVPLWRTTIRRLVDSGSQYPELGLTPCIKHTREYLTTENGLSLYYQVTPDKASLRKNELIIGFRKNLIEEDNRGALTRQETVSMLPVIYLNPQPHQNIIDLCAAPGMKYLQILDEVHSALIYRHRQNLCDNRGMILANDVCQSRVSTLAHHVKAMNCPSAAVTNYDASRFPTLFNADGKKILFDSILADVPCSCDGTTRKAPEIWTTWKASGGLHMHKLQLSIVKRALQMLKLGGIMVYSTCSLNPLENEAIASYVVSEGYREHGVVLQPLEQLEGFKTRKGLLDWLVPNPEGGYFKSYDQVPQHLKERVTPSMFKSQEWNESLAQHVMRILPHDNDTGGFFLFKVKKVAGQEAEEPPQEIRAIDVAAADPDNKISLKRGSKLLHEYLMYKDSNPEEFDIICRFYGIEGEQLEKFGRVLTTKRHSRTSCTLISHENAAVLFHRRKPPKPQRHGDRKAAFEEAQMEAKNLASGTTEGQFSAAARRKQDTEMETCEQKKWERSKYALLGMRAFTKLESKATLGSSCEMRISQEAAVLLLTIIKRRLLFCNMAFCADIVKGNVQANQIFDHEKAGNISCLDTCRSNGMLESGGCILVIVPQWGNCKIPAKGIQVDNATGINFDHNLAGQLDPSLVPVPDLLETMPMACVISDNGCLFPYAPPQVIQLLKTMLLIN